MKRIERVVIIGSGNLAEALAQAIAASGARLVQIFARNAERGRAIAAMCGTEWCGDPERLAVADIYIVAVSDRAVGEVTECLPIPEGAVVAHTAGSVGMDVLAERYCRAVFYPMQTFTAGRRVDFREIPIFLEIGDKGLEPMLEEFARRLSDRVIWSDSEQRRRIHLAAVFVCNFVNHLYAVGDSIATSAGLDFGVLKSLVRETAAKALDVEHPAEVQTGPAARGDSATMERHAEMLGGDELLKEIYSTISQSIWETSRKI